MFTYRHEGVQYSYETRDEAVKNYPPDLAWINLDETAEVGGIQQVTYYHLKHRDGTLWKVSASELTLALENPHVEPPLNWG